MNVNRMVIISLFFVLLVSSIAQANSDYLYVRQLPSSQAYETVLTLDSSVCVQVNAVSPVQIAGSDVFIESHLRCSLSLNGVSSYVVYSYPDSCLRKNGLYWRFSSRSLYSYLESTREFFLVYFLVCTRPNSFKFAVGSTSAYPWNFRPRLSSGAFKNTTKIYLTSKSVIRKQITAK